MYQNIPIFSKTITNTVTMKKTILEFQDRLEDLVYANYKINSTLVLSEANSWAITIKQLEARLSVLASQLKPYLDELPTKTAQKVREYL